MTTKTTTTIFLGCDSIEINLVSNHVLIGPVLPYYTPTCQLNAHAHGPAHITLHESISLVAKLIIR